MKGLSGRQLEAFQMAWGPEEDIAIASGCAATLHSVGDEPDGKTRTRKPGRGVFAGWSKAKSRLPGADAAVDSDARPPPFGSFTCYICEQYSVVCGMPVP